MHMWEAGGLVTGLSPRVLETVWTRESAVCLLSQNKYLNAAEHTIQHEQLTKVVLANTHTECLE